ncbi:DNA repair protein RecO [Dokdonella soli]|uniref:DNA repair protein RecO n=1 Tax=Dokdonella soli TaxID=529810 RepID=A0ABN1IE87_9GAMM
MRIEQQPAFILHARPYRETSLLLEAFTRDHGRVGLVARGVRRERSRMPRGVLQPLQPLLLGWIARGELGTLTGAEAASTPFALSGEALLAAIYINELVLRLSGRNDIHADAFAAYALCLARLADNADMAWTLRRFERDLLADLGYALALTHTVGGTPIEADVDYAYDPDAGAREWRVGSIQPRVAGGALLALDLDESPTADQLAQLRRLVRAVVRHLVGGELNAWALSARPSGSAPA